MMSAFPPKKKWLESPLGARVTLAEASRFIGAGWHFQRWRAVGRRGINRAMAVALARPADVVLGADTIVVLDGEIFGKPRDQPHAEKMLGRLAGRTHEVITGVCLVEWHRPVVVKFHETTRVKFRELSGEQIRDYLASIDPLDKAGAYAAQEDEGRIIECVEGSLTNVIGLPVERTLAALRQSFSDVIS